MKKLPKLLSLTLLTLTLSSCTSLVEKTGRAVSHNAYKGGIQIDEEKGVLYYSHAFYRGWLEFTADYTAAEGIVSITEGFIKRDDSIIRGDEAVRLLTNRKDRIDAIAAWMKAQKDAPHFVSEKAFDEYWRSVLLPETVKRKKRPASYTRAALVSPKTDYAERFKWNRAYTDYLFPTTGFGSGYDANAELAKLRREGAILRDFNEALAWIVMEVGRTEG